MRSLVMSLFSRDFIKTEIVYQYCFNVLKYVQYSHSAWFLDGRTSILVNIMIWAVCCLVSCVLANLQSQQITSMMSHATCLLAVYPLIAG